MWNRNLVSKFEKKPWIYLKKKSQNILSKNPRKTLPKPFQYQTNQTENNLFVSETRWSQYFTTFALSLWWRSFRSFPSISTYDRARKLGCVCVWAFFFSSIWLITAAQGNLSTFVCWLLDSVVVCLFTLSLPLPKLLFFYGCIWIY